MSAYNAAKGAVTNFTRALALEYGSRGVRVDAVAPSLTSIEATAALEKVEAVNVAFADRLPLGRATTPGEIAGSSSFSRALTLVSSTASFCRSTAESVRQMANRIP